MSDVRLSVTGALGSLGAGRTTLVHKSGGWRGAALVNDMSEVNADADLVRRSGGHAEAPLDSGWNRHQEMVDIGTGQTSPTIPVTLLTGFLGSGKTTLLNALLRDPSMRDTAIIVNEFGSISIDHDLVQHGRGQYLVTSNGCLCCTAGSDIRTSLFELTDLMGGAKGIPAFSRVIVETTGLADPAPIVNSLISGSAAALGLRDQGLDAEKVTL